ncbi:uracil-DNA glycosylase [Xaviernesmea oryzae]|uniref:Type-4 uracil-DNA glycosylase n=1 Tax=Xaviernesmea oryzae TaxID=464029 RepID=A0A1Q9B1K8_9HYPH|nr:uracil-DNA glycosylase [Xaviernesmea oryzae]OLP61888.1 uracil-DNA glycosylase [Xaviernesmea oryzae]SEL74253.1 DNA polymerase [Xaviernesmea oryzae]
MIPADSLDPAELAALLHFHADAGVEWLIADEPVDRFAEFLAQQEARRRAAPPAASQTREIQASRELQPAHTPAPQAPATRKSARPDKAAAPQRPPAAVAIPDEQAVADARDAARRAQSLAELRAAMDRFTGCNLKNSARSLVFVEGSPTRGILILGPMPSGDDDRDGQPFAGRNGAMLDRMLAAIGLDRASVMLGNVIGWRPPGNRVPSARETEICRPFIERQVELIAPRHLLVLGNFTARFFFGGQDTIHHLRGQWRDVTMGSHQVPALATLHPQDLFAAPACKKLAWEDLLTFRKALDA